MQIQGRYICFMRFAINMYTVWQISRAWNLDVMRFFLERGADILSADGFGVTPLHVASALDYEDMIWFLLDRGGMFVHVFNLQICYIQIM